MIPLDQKESMKLLIKNTLTLLCKNGLSFDQEFGVEALIGITVDKDDVFLVSMNEIIKKREEDVDFAVPSNPEPEPSGDLEEDSGGPKRKKPKVTSNPSIDLSPTKMTMTTLAEPTTDDLNTNNEFDTLLASMKEELKDEHHDDMEEDTLDYDMNESMGTTLEEESDFQTPTSTPIRGRTKRPAKGTPSGANEPEIAEESTTNSLGEGTSQKLKTRENTDDRTQEYPCYCGKICYNEKDLSVHRYYTHEKPRPSCICKICGEGFAMYVYLRKHQVDVHDAELYECLQCFKKYKYKTSLSNHVKTHYPSETTIRCPECSQEFSQERLLREHRRVIHEGRRVLCKICDKSFKWRSSLKSHMRSHKDKANRSAPEPMSYFCPDVSCGYSSQEKVNVIEHYESQHGQNTKQKRGTKCGNCRKDLGTSDALADHRKYECNQIFKCFVCNKMFKTKAGLKMHSRSHGGKHQCSICKERFTSQRSLRKHKSRDHQRQDLLACECSKVFKDKTNFAKHKEMCDMNSDCIGYCLDCGLYFQTKNLLREHMAEVHVSVAKFACMFCDERFKLSTSHRNHIQNCPRNLDNK